MTQPKPAAYLLVILPLIVIGGILFPYKLISIYSASKGIPVASVPNVSGALIAIPALVVWLPVALLLANFVIAALPPLHRTAVRYVRANHLPGFWPSQLKLLWCSLAITAICVPIIIYGFAR